MYGFTDLNYAKRNFDDDDGGVGGVGGDGNWKRKGPNGLTSCFGRSRKKKKEADSNEYKPNQKLHGDK